MRAIILAAGMSMRLRPMTEHAPKTLISLGERTILEHIVRSLLASGVNDIAIVVGHGASHVHTEAKRLETLLPGLALKFVLNEEYETKGNIYSLYVAKDLFDTDVIVINSDTIFHESLMGALMADASPNAFLVDDHKELGEEEMKVLVDKRGHVTHIHKALDPKRARGEYIGVLKFSKESAPEIIRGLAEVLACDPALYYEDGLQAVLHRVHFGVCSTAGLPCMEIDTHEDLAVARDMISSCYEATKEKATVA